MPIVISFLKHERESWAQQIDAIRTRLGAPNNPLLFPSHYLKSTFLNIGGEVVLIENQSGLVGVGFLFPRGVDNLKKEFTMRFHECGAHERGRDPSWRESLIQSVQNAFPSTRITFYSPKDQQTYLRSNINAIQLTTGENIHIHTPTSSYAFIVRDLQRRFWDSTEDELYPTDIHSVKFRLATSLVASCEEKVVGFLFGFYKFGGPALPALWEQRTNGGLRVESQLLGVLSEYRNHGIAFYLKKTQAEIALLNNIDIINWTVDPLQFNNAVLNFGKLKATAFNFYRGYYDFNNVLNRVPASRFGITWLPNTERVKKALRETSSSILQIPEMGNKAIQKVNIGTDQLRFNARSSKIAIELPENWTRLQAEDRNLAIKWRDTTDRLFEHYLGPADGKYIITGVGKDAAKNYLVADMVNRELIDHLSL